MEENRCRYWLTAKRRQCANSSLPNSQFCGNHDPRYGERRVPCPIDPSHSVFKENLESHMRKCPLKKHATAMESLPYYSKGFNVIADTPDEEQEFVSSEAKRKAVNNLCPTEFRDLIRKIVSIHSSISQEIKDSYASPNTCGPRMNHQLDGQVPFQEKHVVQQASILSNTEVFGILQKSSEESAGEREELPAVVEFGAGRGYLAHMLTKCYGAKKVFLVERRSYKLKADRTLRKHDNVVLERLRIDIEDLYLQGIESLKGLPYISVGKHLCGPATDLAIRCSLQGQGTQNQRTVNRENCYLQGLALATCCHHLCQWNCYTNKDFFCKLGITKDEFHAITWFTSWAVDADHSSADHTFLTNHELNISGLIKVDGDKMECIARSMPALERAALGFMCKDIIDAGRLFWLRERGLDAQLLRYVPLNISPENLLLIAKFKAL